MNRKSHIYCHSWQLKQKKSWYHKISAGMMKKHLKTQRSQGSLRRLVVVWSRPTSKAFIEANQGLSLFFLPHIINGCAWIPEWRCSQCPKKSRYSTSTRCNPCNRLKYYLELRFVFEEIVSGNIGHRSSPETDDLNPHKKNNKYRTRFFLFFYKIKKSIARLK